MGADSPGAGTPLDTCCKACWDTTCTLPLWTELLTHSCENITLPQTSFAGGNKTSKLESLPPLSRIAVLSTLFLRNSFTTTLILNTMDKSRLFLRCFCVCVSYTLNVTSVSVCREMLK